MTDQARLSDRTPLPLRLASSAELAHLPSERLAPGAYERDRDGGLVLRCITPSDGVTLAAYAGDVAVGTIRVAFGIIAPTLEDEAQRGREAAAEKSAKHVVEMVDREDIAQGRRTEKLAAPDWASIDPGVRDRMAQLRAAQARASEADG